MGHRPRKRLLVTQNPLVGFQFDGSLPAARALNSFGLKPNNTNPKRQRESEYPLAQTGHLLSSRTRNVQRQFDESKCHRASVKTDNSDFNLR